MIWIWDLQNIKQKCYSLDYFDSLIHSLFLSPDVVMTQQISELHMLYMTRLVLTHLHSMNAGKQCDEVNVITDLQYQ
jgi:hypothetical protein